MSWLYEIENPVARRGQPVRPGPHSMGRAGHREGRPEATGLASGKRQSHIETRHPREPLLAFPVTSQQIQAYSADDALSEVVEGGRQCPSDATRGSSAIVHLTRFHAVTPKMPLSPLDRLCYSTCNNLTCLLKLGARLFSGVGLILYARFLGGSGTLVLCQKWFDV